MTPLRLVFVSAASPKPSETMAFLPSDQVKLKIVTLRRVTSTKRSCRTFCKKLVKSNTLGGRSSEACNERILTCWFEAMAFCCSSLSLSTLLRHVSSNWGHRDPKHSFQLLQGLMELLVQERSSWRGSGDRTHQSHFPASLCGFKQKSELPKYDVVRCSVHPSPHWAPPSTYSAA